MTVLELISHWTPEERSRYADLIAECLERERFLTDLKIKIKTSEEEMEREMDVLLCRLNNFSRTVNKVYSQIQDIYFRLAKGEGNA